MTPRERAEEAMRFQIGPNEYGVMKGRFRESQIASIEQAINAAVEAEREACAKIVESWARNHPSAQFTVFKAAQDIRARSNASSDPQAD